MSRYEKGVISKNIHISLTGCCPSRREFSLHTVFKAYLDQYIINSISSNITYLVDQISPPDFGTGEELRFSISNPVSRGRTDVSILHL